MDFVLFERFKKVAMPTIARTMHTVLIITIFRKDIFCRCRICILLFLCSFHNHKEDYYSILLILVFYLVISLLLKLKCMKPYRCKVYFHDQLFFRISRFTHTPIKVLFHKAHKATTTKNECCLFQFMAHFFSHPMFFIR